MTIRRILSAGIQGPAARRGRPRAERTGRGTGRCRPGRGRRHPGRCRTAVGDVNAGRELPTGGTGFRTGPTKTKNNV